MQITVKQWVIRPVSHERSVSIRDLKQVGRQRDDGGQNHLVKISYCKESLSFIIHRMKSIQRLRRNNAWLQDSDEFY